VYLLALKLPNTIALVSFGIGIAPRCNSVLRVSKQKETTFPPEKMQSVMLVFERKVMQVILCKISMRLRMEEERLALLPTKDICIHMGSEDKWLV
jgi:hypothetical protein